MSDGLSRRQLLLGGTVALGAAGAGALAGCGAAGSAPAPAPVVAPPAFAAGAATVPFFGPHQAGIAIAPQAHSAFIAYRLTSATDRDGIRRMLALITEDAARLTAGRPALADTEPELAETPAHLTVTVGFGPELVARVDATRAPGWLRPLPVFSIDRLRPEWSGGDLLLEVASDDPLTVRHAARTLTKGIRRYATVHWRQDGFRNAAGSVPDGRTQRNLFGQLDGTANPPPASDDFDRVVWSGARGPAWLAGGTSYVVRRIAMNLDTWDEVDRPVREQTIGRRLDTGAPLSGGGEFDSPDLAARTATGLPLISPLSHVARARTADGSPTIVRRPYNYDLSGPAGVDAGQIFASFQAHPGRQFVPMQRRLAEADLLNAWTTPIGSAVFALPPGCAEGGFVGETLFV